MKEREDVLGSLSQNKKIKIFKILLPFFWKLCYNKNVGALAQLGARHIRIVEATGSNPVCSS